MEKNNNRGVIILLIVIIIILGVLCVLFATNKISINSTNINDDTNTNKGVTEKEKNTSKEMTNDEALSIVKDLFYNDTVKYLVNESLVTYCGNGDGKTYSESELGLNYTWNGMRKCSGFHSYDELVNYFKKYVTEDFYNNTASKRTVVSEKNPAGMYNYYESNGDLYAANTGKGSLVMSYDDNAKITIDSFDNNQIKATINANDLLWDNSTSTHEIKMTVVNDNGNWKIDAYTDNKK